MRRKVWMTLFAVAAATVFLFAAADASVSGGGDGPRSKLTIIAPAAPGGGWDAFAREGQQGMRSAGIAANVQVVNIPGASGTIGLGQFVGMEGRNDVMMVTGGVMVGGIVLGDSAVSLDDTTPIARLADDYNVLVVPADSPFETMDDFRQELAANPGGTAIAGGSLGGIDHLLAGMLAEEAGISPGSINYLAYPGGGEVVTSLLSHTAKAGLSGYNDFRDQIESGNLRALGLSAAEPVDGIDVPTFIEEGIDVQMSNWRGYVAPAGVDDATRQQLIEMVTELRDSPEWQETLQRDSWQDSFLVGDEFTEFIREETERTEEIVKEMGL